jgi:hypothetical protein
MKLQGSGVFHPKTLQSQNYQPAKNRLSLNRLDFVHGQLENEPDEFTRSRLLKLLSYEAEKSCLIRKQLDRIDCHTAELRELNLQASRICRER